jgi:WD40 repeat protein
VVNVWDINNQNTPKWQFTEHQAAVKALAWCPWQKDLLATGGGTADRTIKFWNVTTGTLLNRYRASLSLILTNIVFSIDTQSQVSQLMWSKNPNCKEIISAHGYAQNQLTVWTYPSLLRVAELKAHDQRQVDSLSHISLIDL